ncbi:MAG: methyltransferase domain-containing protein [Gammaproteobacteria bacterium]|nr:methyltransferase domain-containing protein [Gammaproteobacteria bacterium]
MEPSTLGRKYDRIANWWNERHFDSKYGVSQFEKALDYSQGSGAALDVGCGAGGRFIRLMENRGYSVTGLDVSEEMIALASKNHPDEFFLVQDICLYKTKKKFEFIVAWDSIFHLPLELQKPTVAKLCNLLVDNGILIYTFGDDVGAHEDVWHGDRFYYSSIGINGNLKVMMENGVTCKHMELDQWPLNHVYIIGQKTVLEQRDDD